MLPIDLARVVRWCAANDIPAEPRGDQVWIPNPAAPPYGVAVSEAPGMLVWTLALPRPVAAERLPAVLRALARLDARPALGAWIVDTDGRVAYRVVLPTDGIAAADGALMTVLRDVIEAGNTHVHELIDVIDGR